MYLRAYSVDLSVIGLVENSRFVNYYIRCALTLHVYNVNIWKISW